MQFCIQSLLFLNQQNHLRVKYKLHLMHFSFGIKDLITLNKYITYPQCH